MFGDEHIKRVEAENKQLREDYLRVREENVAKQKLEELLDQLQGRKQTPPEEPKQPTGTPEKAIDMRQIESLIENRMKQTELTRTYNQNLQSVQQKLVEKYGPDYATHYQNELTRLDLSKEEADDLARRKPTTFMSMLGLNQPKPTIPTYQAPPRNTPNMPTPQLPEKRDWAYYENLRKTDRNAYLSQKVQVQMLQDRMEQGEAFNSAGFDPHLGGAR